MNKISIRDLTDYDYLSGLSDKDKEWLDKFTKEYYVASFDKNKKDRLHKKKKDELDSYKSNNRRNQDITSYLGNYKAMASYEGLNDDSIKAASPEDSLIELIDKKRS